MDHGYQKPRESKGYQDRESSYQNDRPIESRQSFGVGNPPRRSFGPGNPPAQYQGSRNEMMEYYESERPQEGWRVTGINMRRRSNFVNRISIIMNCIM